MAPPVVFLEGGPGGQGLQRWARDPERYLCFAEFGDVIVLDQRGVGLSRPALDSPYRLSLPFDRAISRDEWLEELTVKAALTVGFWQDRGVNLQGYTTQESADDVAELVHALGYATFRPVGGSYGSHLALSVMRRHPNRVDRAFLSMVEGPNDTYKLPSSIDAQLARIAAMAAAAPELEGQVPDLVNLMLHVFEQLDKRPVEVSGVVIGGFDVRYLTAQAIGDGDFLRLLPVLFLAAARGEFDWWAPRVRDLRRATVPSLMSLLMDCASGATDGRAAQVRNEAVGAVLGDFVDLPLPYVCRVLDGPDLDEDFRSPLVSDVPTLLTSGTLDARTPPSNARDVMRGLSNVHHLLVHNAAHHAVHREPEVLQAVRDFMAGRDVTVTETSIDFAFATHLDPLP